MGRASDPVVGGIGMRWVAIMCTVWVFGACGSSEPETMEDCLKMEAGTKRDACLQEKIVEAFREDPERAEQIIAEQDNSEGLRDFMWYLITREVDPNSNRFCEKIESQALGERCRAIVARPHLHRDLLKDDGNQGAGGGRAPGAAPQ